MRRGLLLGLLAVVLAGASFVAGVLVERHLLTGSPPEPADRHPTRDEILAYLDGKTVRLPDGDKPEITIRNGQIDALEVEKIWSRINDDPWSGDVHFLLTTDRGRYAVDGRVSYRNVEKQIVFY